MPPPLQGFDSVEASAARLRRLRYVVERSLRLTAGWIALTPELSAKLLLGRHVWDQAQHADLLGRRLLELRAPAQASEPAGPGVVAVLDLVESAEAPGQTPERLAGVYRVLKPGLLGHYRAQLERCNPVYEPPTRRLLERLIADESRHLGAAEAVLAHLLAPPERAARAAAWVDRLAAELVAARGLTGEGPPPDAAPDAEAWRDGRAEGEEFVRLETRAASWAMPVELAAAVAALGEALVAGARDLSALAAPGSGLAEAVAGLGPAGPLATHRVVACARLGGRRAVKLRLEGPLGSATLLLRWAAGPAGWQVEHAEPAALEPAPSA
jgi:hypothetical protein